MSPGQIFRGQIALSQLSIADIEFPVVGGVQNYDHAKSNLGWVELWLSWGFVN